MFRLIPIRSLSNFSLKHGFFWKLSQSCGVPTVNNLILVNEPDFCLKKSRNRECTTVKFGGIQGNPGQLSQFSLSVKSVKSAILTSTWLTSSWIFWHLCVQQNFLSFDLIKKNKSGSIIDFCAILRVSLKVFRRSYQENIWFWCLSQFTAFLTTISLVSVFNQFDSCQVIWTSQKCPVVSIVRYRGRSKSNKFLVYKNKDGIFSHLTSFFLFLKTVIHDNWTLEKKPISLEQHKQTNFGPMLGFHGVRFFYWSVQ